MAAGQGFKTFTTGEVLSAADVNGYLMQGVLVFANSAERDSEITSPQEGQFAYLKDTNVTTYYTGSAWASASAAAISYSLLNTGGTALSGSSTTVSGLSGYNYLMLYVSAASTAASGSSIRIALNNVENNNYSYNAFTLQNTTPAWRSSNNGSFLYTGYADAAQSVRIVCNIDAANSTGLKPIRWFGNPSSQDANSELVHGLGYDNQASVISSITLKTGSTFDAGTMFVYGAN